MKGYILITGATSGIGEQLARQLAEQQRNLILVARSEDKLRQLQKELSTSHGVSVLYFVKDLSNKGGAEELYVEVRQQDLLVTHLVNNAGVGNYGHFTATSLEEEVAMIELNISSLVILTKLFAKDMVVRGSGRIMNIASVIAFLPMPYMSVYSATKSFVLAFSQTLAAELEDTGVVVTALAPGITETAFVSPELRQTNLVKSGKPASVETVAAEGVKLLLHGKGKKIVGFQNRLNAVVAALLPERVMIKIKMKLASAQ
jgi:uncharacterized protein